MGHTMKHLEHCLAWVHMCEPSDTSNRGSADLCAQLCTCSVPVCYNEGRKECCSTGCPHRGKASREGLFVG